MKNTTMKNTKNYPRLQFFIMKNDEKNIKTDEELIRNFDKLWNFEPTEKRIMSYDDALKAYIQEYKDFYENDYCFGKTVILSEDDEEILKVEQSPLFVRWLDDSDHELILIKN